MKVSKRLIISILFPLCLLTLAQCGLEYIPYLTSPQRLPSGSFFRVRKLKDNDTESGTLPKWEYLGIELYYKMYVPGDTLETNYTKQSELVANGFYRLSSHPDENKIVALKPVLEIDTLAWDEDRDFTIDLTIDPDPFSPPDIYPSIKEESTDTDFVTQIRRGVLYNSDENGNGYFRPFLWDDSNATNNRGFATGHADVGPPPLDRGLYDFMSDPANTGSPITVVMYALSYGRIEDLTDLYSDAEYLGSQDFNFGW